MEFISFPCLDYYYRLLYMSAEHCLAIRYRNQTNNSPCNQQRRLYICAVCYDIIVQLTDKLCDCVD